MALIVGATAKSTSVSAVADDTPLSAKDTQASPADTPVSAKATAVTKKQPQVAAADVLPASLVEEETAESSTKPEEEAPAQYPFRDLPADVLRGIFGRI